MTWQKLLAKDIEDRGVVCLVGAGLSLRCSGSDTAGWIGLLEHGLDWLKGNEKISESEYQQARADLQSGALEQILKVGELISAEFAAPSGEFYRWLQSSIGSLDVHNRDWIDAIESLGVPVITTNYDELFEKVTRRTSCTWKDKYVLDEFVHCAAESSRKSCIYTVFGIETIPSYLLLGTTER